ncbi:MAG TPA: sugar phosphate isomerase/epimerase family protein [Bryobacteraceae bacterium]|nr:sugar phosphate isomerase/epimerase family protein [Bryobacteraceae bacterium]
MQLGAVTYNVLKDWDLETILTNLEAAGFTGVELRTGHKHGVEPSLDAAGRARVRAQFARSKVRLVSLGSTCEFESPDPAVRQHNVEVARQFIDLAHDTGALGVKVRPNGLPKGIPAETTFSNIASGLRAAGDYGSPKGIEIWMEVHGRDTQLPPNAAAIMRKTAHENVGLCWNSNPTDIVHGSLKPSFDLLRPWIRNCHIHDLTDPYPYRELFALLRKSNYDRYTLCEAPESKEPERFLRYYKALWTELNRECA